MVAKIEMCKKATDTKNDKQHATPETPDNGVITIKLPESGNDKQLTGNVQYTPVLNN